MDPLHRAPVASETAAVLPRVRRLRATVAEEFVEQRGREQRAVEIDVLLAAFDDRDHPAHRGFRGFQSTVRPRPDP